MTITSSLPTFSNVEVNTLSELTIIGGSYKEVLFYAFTSGCVAIDLTYQPVLWNLYPYQDEGHVAISKYANGYDGYALVKLLSAETENLSGKYIQEARVIGSLGYDYSLGRGIVNIIPAIREA